MANRYPLVVDTSDSNKIKEIPNGDNLLLTGNSITGVVNVTASGAITASSLNVTGTITYNSNPLATVASSGAYSDLIGAPGALSDLTDDLNVLVPGDAIGQLNNNVGYLTGVGGVNPATFADLSSTPTTLAGYGITDAATLAQGALATTALQPGADITTLVNNAGYVTITDLQSGLVTVDVNSTGDLNGSVFADDSTVMIDSILAAVNLDGTIRGNVIPVASAAYDLGSLTNQFKDLHISGSIPGYISIADLKTLVAAAGTYGDFQTAIAAL